MNSPPPRVTISAKALCPSPTRSNVTLGDHGIVIDEPEAWGGTGKGATPLEVLMGSLAGCTNVIAHRVAKEMKIQLDNMSVEVAGTFDTAVLKGEEVPAPFPEIALNIKVRTAASDGELEKLRGELARRCPVSAVLRGSGAVIKSTWKVDRP